MAEAVLYIARRSSGLRRFAAALALLAQVGCSHRAAKTTLVVSAAPLALGVLIAPTCAPHHAEAPDGSELLCPIGIGLLALGGLMIGGSVISLLLPDPELAEAQAQEKREQERAAAEAAAARVELDGRQREIDMRERQRAVAEDLARQARAAAHSNDCETVKALDKKVTALDPGTDTTLRLDGAVEACLR